MTESSSEYSPEAVARTERPLDQFTRMLSAGSKEEWEQQETSRIIFEYGCTPDQMTEGQLAEFLIAECPDFGPETAGDPWLYRVAHLKRNYGMTPEEYDELVESQGGRCAICGTLPTQLVVDHDHVTNAVRGLLCKSCNALLGQYHDSASGLIQRAERDEVSLRIHAEERKWVNESLFFAAWANPEMIADKSERFMQAWERQGKRCAGCEVVIPRPEVQLMDPHARARVTRYVGPFLRSNRETNAASLLCADCFHASVPRCQGTSQVASVVLRHAAQYLDRPPVHPGRQAPSRNRAFK